MNSMCSGSNLKVWMCLITCSSSSSSTRGKGVVVTAKRGATSAGRGDGGARAAARRWDAQWPVTHLLQAREDRVLALEGVLAEEHVKHGVLVVLARLPVRVGHRDLRAGARKNRVRPWRARRAENWAR